jgi:nitrogen-specific signal transduction histidine kinase
MNRLAERAPTRSSESQTLAERRLLISAWKETLSDLIPGLAHDLNNALTGILSLSEVFLGQIDSGHSFHEGLSLIKQKAQQASQLIHRVTRLHQDKPGERTYCDANSMAREVVEILSKLVSRRIELIPKLTKDSLAVYTDVVEFRRVLLGLVTSAAGQMPEKGKILFQTSRHRARPRLGRLSHGALPRFPVICLSLGLSDGGLTKGQLESLFGPCTTDGELLNGPGLSVLQAKRFVEGNGGAVSVEARPGAGTIFRLWLPEADFTEAEKNCFPGALGHYIK